MRFGANSVGFNVEKLKRMKVKAHILGSAEVSLKVSVVQLCGCLLENKVCEWVT